MNAFSISTRFGFDDSYAQRAIGGVNAGGVLGALGALDARCSQQSVQLPVVLLRDGRVS